MNLETLLQLLDRVRTSLWFVPGIIALCALGLASLTLLIDHAAPEEALSGLPLLYSGTPDGARAVLSTIATSVITTAGVVFSMTIVSLQLASSQFGPRLLRTFLRDRGNQIVLGVFVGIFLYCILVLPSVDSSDGSAFVPRIAVTLGVLLATIGLGLLVYFIDHVAQSIHADAVIEAVGAEMDGTIGGLFPEPVGEGAPEVDEAAPAREGDGAAVRAARSGYLRFINGDTLMRTASERGLLVRIEAAPGRYVIEGDVLARVWPGPDLSEESADSVRGAFKLGAHRTTLQDATFAFEQLAEMAVRALSPGINDPATAVHCVDRIGVGLSSLVGRRRPSSLRRDEEGVVRVEAPVVGIREVLESAVEPISRCADVHLAVWIRLLETLGAAHARAAREADRAAISALGRRIAADARARFEHASDAQRIASSSAWA